VSFEKGEIARAFDAEEAEVRRRAVQELPRLGGEDAAALLMRGLGDSDWRVRKEAVQTAPRIAARDGVIRHLISALGNRNDIGLRNAAVEALIGIGREVVSYVVDSLRSLDEDGRKLAVETLAQLPDMAAIDALAKSLDDKDVNVQVAAAEALGRAGLAGENGRSVAMDVLIRALSRNVPLLSLASLSSLRQLEAVLPFEILAPLVDQPLLRRVAIEAASGNVDSKAIGALATAIGDFSPHISREAALGLARSVEASMDDRATLLFAETSLGAIPQAAIRLRELARDIEDPAARGAALLLLGLVRDANDVELLVDALAQEDVAEYAELGLELFGEDAVKPLVAVGRTAAPNARGAAISMLPLVDRGAVPDAVAVLRDSLGDGSTDVVVAALRSLATVGAAGDIRHVFEMSDRGDVHILLAKNAALSSLAGRFPKVARDLLKGLDPHSDAALSGCVLIEALGRLGLGADADESFAEVAVAHRDSRVRRGAVEALATIASDDAVRMVSFALADEEEQVALAAIRALGRMRAIRPLAQLMTSSKNPVFVGAALRALGEADDEVQLAHASALASSADYALASIAIETIGLSSADGREQALAGALTHSDPAVVCLILSELVRLHGDRSREALAWAIEHPSREVRQHAAELLGLDGSEEARTLIRARLVREDDPQVKEALLLAPRSLRARPGGS